MTQRYFYEGVTMNGGDMDREVLWKVIATGSFIVVFGILLVVVPGTFNATPFWDKAFATVGAVFITVGVLDLVREFTSSNRKNKEIFKSIAGIIQREFDRQRKQSSLGVIDVCSRFPTTKFSEIVESAKEIQIFQTWLPNINDLLPSLFVAAKQDADIKILLLDPDSDVAHLRANELGYKKSDFVADQIRANLQELEVITKEYNNVEVRLYPSLPSFAIYKASHITFLGFYWSTTQSVQNFQVELNSQGEFGVEVAKHFEKIWDKSSELRQGLK